MRKYTLALLVSITALLSACNESSPSAPNTSGNTDRGLVLTDSSAGNKLSKADEAFFADLVASGYSPSDIEFIGGGYFVIEKDMVISRGASDPSLVAARAMHRRFDFDLTAKNIRQVKVIASRNADKIYDKNINAAIGVWNHSTSPIHLTRIFDLAKADDPNVIYIRLVDEKGTPEKLRNYVLNTKGVLGLGINPPYSEVAGHDLLLRPSFGNRISGNVTRIIAHEMGHNLGFAHTDARGAPYIDYTAKEDRNSLMNAKNDMYMTSLLSLGDYVAARRLYPFNEAEKLAIYNEEERKELLAAEGPNPYKRTPQMQELFDELRTCNKYGFGLSNMCKK